MTVTIQWDSDAPITGQPQEGTVSKVYAAAGPGRVTITDEAIGGDSVTLDFTVPLSLTTVEATPVSVDSAGDLAARTITIAGEGFPANTAGTVALAMGVPGIIGATVVSTGVTTNTAGVFTGVTLVVPADTDAGDYHIMATFGVIADLATAVTITNTALAAPTGLASPAQTATTVDLTWTAVTDAEQYVVRWSLTGQETWTEQAAVATTTDTVTGLTPETSYDFQVKATAAGATDSPWSSTLTQATTAQPQLATPTNAAAGTTTTTEIPFSWDAVTSAETYTVSWRPVGGQFTDISGIATTNTTVTGLDPDTDYELRVKAVAAGFTDSDWSAIVSATTQSLGTLAAPTGLSSPTQTATSVDVSWTAVTNAEQYVVQWAPTGTTTWTSIAPVAGLTATVTGLTASTTYDFQVQATATGWTASPWSSTLTQATTA